MRYRKQAGSGQDMYRLFSYRLLPWSPSLLTTTAQRHAKDKRDGRIPAKKFCRPGAARQHEKRRASNGTITWESTLTENITLRCQHGFLSKTVPCAPSLARNKCEVELKGVGDQLHDRDIDHVAC